MTKEFTSSIARRAKAALKLGGFVLIMSTLTYYVTGCICGMNAGYGKSLLSLNDDQWELSECLYFSSITLTTTGYGDTLGTEKCKIYQDQSGNFRWDSSPDPHTSCPEDQYDHQSESLYYDFSPYTRTLTSITGILGMGFFLFVIAQITAFFVEGGYEAMAAKYRRTKQLNKMKDHVIVCGGGKEGSHAVDQILESGVACSVIDNNQQSIDQLQDRHNKLPCLPGDATVKASLEAAGIERARAVICALPNDGLNLVTVVTIRQQWPDIPIVCRASQEDSVNRLTLAGVNDVINTNRLMGLRLASQLIRPTAVDFLDHILGHTDEQDLQLVGIPIIESEIERNLYDLQLDESPHTRVVALRHQDRTFSYNPLPAFKISKGDQLLVVGKRAQNAQLAAKLSSSVVHEDPQTKHNDPGETNRMTAQSSNQKLDVDTGHYLICGVNNASLHIARELGSTGRSCCVIGQNLESISDLAREYPSISLITGDARSIDVLRAAGIERARGLATTHKSDADNLVIVVTALQTKSDLRVVSLASDDQSALRLDRAGAITHQFGQIGGRRLASQLLRPAVTSLLDRMLVESGAIRFEAVVVNADSPNEKKTLGDADLFGQTGLRVLALRRPGQSKFDIAPGSEQQLSAGTTLIVAGAAHQVDILVSLVGRWE